MNARELVDHIRSGPVELVLNKPLRFRRRTRSNPCDSNEFLRALQSSKTIRKVICWSQLQLGVAEDEWVLLVKTPGSIRYIQNLTLYCTPGSRDFHPFQAVADTVNIAQSLRELESEVEGESLPRDSTGLTALGNALRDHISLQEFVWLDWNELGTAQMTALDPVLRALPGCLHLRNVDIMTKYASAEAMTNLLQLQSATELSLVLELEAWLAVADEIRQSRCNVRTLTLSMNGKSKIDPTKRLLRSTACPRSSYLLGAERRVRNDGKSRLCAY
jgi:hypothetical protein